MKYLSRNFEVLCILLLSLYSSEILAGSLATLIRAPRPIAACWRALIDIAGASQAGPCKTDSRLVTVEAAFQKLEAFVGQELQKRLGPSSPYLAKPELVEADDPSTRLLGNRLLAHFQAAKAIEGSFEGRLVQSAEDLKGLPEGENLSFAFLSHEPGLRIATIPDRKDLPSPQKHGTLTLGMPCHTAGEFRFVRGAGGLEVKLNNKSSTFLPSMRTLPRALRGLWEAGVFPVKVTFEFLYWVGPKPHLVELEVPASLLPTQGLSGVMK